MRLQTREDVGHGERWKVGQGHSGRGAGILVREANTKFWDFNLQKADVEWVWKWGCRGHVAGDNCQGKGEERKQVGKSEVPI